VNDTQIGPLLDVDLMLTFTEFDLRQFADADGVAGRRALEV